MEVASLVLGILPVLIEAADAYRSGMRRIKAGTRKRKTIAALARALRTQDMVIFNGVRSMYVHCDDGDPNDIDDTQIRTCLLDKQNQQMFYDTFGANNAQTFSENLHDCMDLVHRVTADLASLIPELATNQQFISVQAVIDGNKATKKGQIQIVERLSLFFNYEKYDRTIEDLKQATSELAKFLDSLRHAYPPEQKSPKSKATRLAKALLVVRQHAINLHSALVRRWGNPCHQRHELKVFLEDRISTLTSVRNAGNTCFQVILKGSIAQQTDFSHETLFHIESKDPRNTDTFLSSPSQGPRVQFMTPQSPPKNRMSDVPDICATIIAAIGKIEQPIFHLVGSEKLNMTSRSQVATTKNLPPSSISLAKILQDRHDHILSPSDVPWLPRMQLSVTIASSFLQFLRTPWTQPLWAASNIYIPYASDGQTLDLSIPFVCVDFCKPVSSIPNSQHRIDDDLVELGILLLQVWHEEVFETKFAQQLTTSDEPDLRHRYARKWLLDSVGMGVHYYNAAFHCINGLVQSQAQGLGWENPQVWKAVCENIVAPLSVMYKMFSDPSYSQSF